MSFRFLLLFLSLVIWLANGLYAVYVNSLRLEQYRLIRELRELRRENNDLYWKISQTLNYKRGREYALQRGFVPVKPYRVVNFWKTLEGKPLIDFYLVWFGDTPSKIAKKLGIPLKVLVQYNPRIRWGYVIPGMRLIYPVSFPAAEKAEQQNKTSQQGGSEGDNLVPGESQTGNGRGNAPKELQ